MEKVRFYDKRQHFASLLLGRVSVCLGAPGGNSHKRDKCEAGVRGGGGGGGGMGRWRRRPVGAAMSH